MTKTPMKMRRRRSPDEISGFLPLLLVGLVCISLFSWQIAVLFVIGLAPTTVLGLTGKGSNRAQKLQCVAFTNIAGILPFAGQIWAQPRDYMMIITNPINLVTMFGAAAIGYALIYVGPMVAAQILQTIAKERLKTIAQHRAALVEAWGPEVLGDPEGDGEEPAWAQSRR